MGTTFRPYDPDQILMLPPDLREWMSEGHLAHHVSDLVDAVDLSAFHAPYRGDGRRNSPYPKQAPGLVLHRAGVASRRHQFGPSWLGRRPNGGSP